MYQEATNQNHLYFGMPLLRNLLRHLPGWILSSKPLGDSRVWQSLQLSSREAFLFLLGKMSCTRDAPSPGEGSGTSRLSSSFLPPPEKLCLKLQPSIKPPTIEQILLKITLSRIRFQKGKNKMASCQVRLLVAYCTPPCGFLGNHIEVDGSGLLLGSMLDFHV